MGDSSYISPGLWGKVSTVGASWSAWTGVVSDEKVGRTDKTEVQIRVRVDGTEEAVSGTAWTGVVLDEKVGRTDKTEVQIRVRLDGTQEAVSGTAGTGVVSEEEVGGTDLYLLLIASVRYIV